jgi:hypothetical protein
MPVPTTAKNRSRSVKEVEPEVSEQGVKYSRDVRLALVKEIKKEWENMKGEITSGDAFIAHLVSSLGAKGFKSPLNMPLTARGIRFQVHRAGIRFRKSDRTQTPALQGKEPVAKVAAPSSSSPVEQAPNGISPVLHAIITDKSLTEDQRAALIKAFYGVK